MTTFIDGRIDELAEHLDALRRARAKFGPLRLELVAERSFWMTESPRSLEPDDCRDVHYGYHTLALYHEFGPGVAILPADGVTVFNRHDPEVKRRIAIALVDIAWKRVADRPEEVSDGRR